MSIEGGRSAPRPLEVGKAQAASPSVPPPSGWRLWVLAMRPRTLTISVAPIVVGGALAWAEFGTFHPVPILAALLGAVLIQAGTNLWNDVGDAVRGGDQAMRQGPPRVTALGWASPERVRRAALVCFAAAAVIGLALAWRGGWPILAIGAASLLAGWAYSGGPRPIAYTATGEVFVVLFFGIVAVMGTLWLQEPRLTVSGLVVGIAIGLPAAAVLMANNYRDMEPDRMAGRRTLAIRLGIEGSKAAYAAFLLVPFPLLMAPFAPPGAWLSLLAAPMAIREVVAFAGHPRGPAFNKILAETARFQLLLAAMVAVGMVIL